MKINNMKSYIQFLEEKFINTKEFKGRAITKDNCEDLFDAWLEQLEPQEFIDFGDEYGSSKYNEGVSDMHKEAKVSLDELWVKKTGTEY